MQGTLRFTSGLPQAQSLQRVGLLLEEVASTQQAQGKYAASLALRLLSLQVRPLAKDCCFGYTYCGWHHHACLADNAHCCNSGALTLGLMRLGHTWVGD